MNQNELQNSDNQTEQNTRLTDLEPTDEVKGGAGDNVWHGPITLGNTDTSNPTGKHLKKGDRIRIGGLG
jgi:hypothetical protein